MKTLGAWLVIHTMLLAAAHLGYRHYDSAGTPRKVGVAIDASFPMRAVWTSVPRVLERIARDHPGAKFLVISHPGKTGAWARRPATGGVRPFAPRRLDALTKLAAWAEADVVYLVTNAAPGDTDLPPGWTIATGEGWSTP